MEHSRVDIHFEEVLPIQLDPSFIECWLLDVCQAEKHTLERLDIILCTDEYLLRINQNYLNHDYYTDIITFDLSEGPGLIEGELYISLERVGDNAQTQNVPLLDELYRVIVHGLLHLLGYGDKSPKEKKIMTGKEDAYLSLLP